MDQCITMQILNEIEVDHNFGLYSWEMHHIKRCNIRNFDLVLPLKTVATCKGIAAN